MSDHDMSSTASAPGTQEVTSVSRASAAETPDATLTPPSSPRPGSPRDRYLDLLRFVAIARIIVYHSFGFVWLTFVFPAMGVMFALGGSLMANSLSKPGSHPVRGRMRRLLPALWVFGAIVVPAMFIQAIREGDPEELPGFGGLLSWILPVVDPPGTEWAEPATTILWYLVTYLWLVMLSPLAMRAYRRWPLPTILAPLVVLAILTFSGLELDSAAGAVVLNLATFGSCWLAGFAHRDGRLATVPRPRLAVVAASAMTAGAVWAFTHPAESGVDLNDIPLAQGLYSFGFVLLALRLRPDMAWLARSRVPNWLVTAVNARAVTIYLWHNVAIAASYPIGDRLDVWRFGDGVGDVLCVAVALVVVAGVTLALGWVEDLAARRPPRLVPR